MLITSDFEIGMILVVFTLLGVILIGALSSTLRLDRWHPRLVGATVGIVFGLALIEAVPMIT
ncbi:hypothetical protein [Caballeronia cordobensis]|uniref:hypothetical protein n=1 Tax=Caballeronia cordobensis TaxID=1353886 RepID=UPI0006AD8176|nr:hypothetical protein [Caballeronia cordobensis]